MFISNKLSLFLFDFLVFAGNICRSPIAEAVFIDEVKKAGEEANWEIDSAAIGSKTGE